MDFIMIGLVHREALDRLHVRLIMYLVYLRDDQNAQTSTTALYCPVM